MYILYSNTGRTFNFVLRSTKYYHIEIVRLVRTYFSLNNNVKEELQARMSECVRKSLINFNKINKQTQFQITPSILNLLCMYGQALLVRTVID